MSLSVFEKAIISSPLLPTDKFVLEIMAWCDKEGKLSKELASAYMLVVEPLFSLNDLMSICLEESKLNHCVLPNPGVMSFRESPEHTAEHVASVMASALSLLKSPLEVDHIVFTVYSSVTVNDHLVLGPALMVSNAMDSSLLRVEKASIEVFIYVLNLHAKGSTTYKTSCEIDMPPGELSLKKLKEVAEVIVLTDGPLRVFFKESLHQIGREFNVSVAPGKGKKHVSEIGSVSRLNLDSKTSPIKEGKKAKKDV